MEVKKTIAPKTKEVLPRNLKVGMIMYLPATKKERAYHEFLSKKWYKDIRRYQVNWYTKADGIVASTYPHDWIFQVVEDEESKSDQRDKAKT